MQERLWRVARALIVYNIGGFVMKRVLPLLVFVCVVMVMYLNLPRREAKKQQAPNAPQEIQEKKEEQKQALVVEDSEAKKELKEVSCYGHFLGTDLACYQLAGLKLQTKIANKVRESLFEKVDQTDLDEFQEKAKGSSDRHRLWRIEAFHAWSAWGKAKKQELLDELMSRYPLRAEGMKLIKKIMEEYSLNGEASVQPIFTEEDFASLQKIERALAEASKHGGKRAAAQFAKTNLDLREEGNFVFRRDGNNVLREIFEQVWKPLEKSEHDHLWEQRKKEVQESKADLALQTEGRATRVIISPDGTLIAAATYRGVHLWTREGKLLQKWTGEEYAYRGIAFSPDSKNIAVGSSYGTLKVFSTGTGELLHTFSGLGERNGHKTALSTVAVIWRGDYIAAAEMKEDCGIWHWPSRKKIFLQSVYPYGPQVIDFSVKEDGSIEEVLVLAWKLVKAKPRQEATVLEEPNDMRFRDYHAEKKIALWEKERKLELRHFPSGKLLSSFAHEKFVGQSAESWYHSFAQDGRYLVVGGDNGFLQVIETATGNVVAKKRYGSGWLQGDWGYHYNGDGLRDVAIHMENDGSLTIAAAGWGPDSVKIWKLPSKQ